MDDQAVLDAIARARRLVGEAEIDIESPLGSATYKELLRLGLKQGAPSGLDARPSVGSAPAASATTATSPSAGTPLSKASAWVGVEEAQLLDSFQFTDEVQLGFWHGSLPNPKADRQRVVALTKLGLERIAFDREEIPAREINEACEQFECFDQNLPQNLLSRRLVSRRGTRGAYSYRLTHEGIDAARQAVRGLLSAD